MLKRKPLKRVPLKIYPKHINKISKSKIAKIEHEKEQSDKQKQLFYNIWESNPHRCQSCNKFLGNEIKTYFFDHLLEKSKYKDLRYNEDNIFICCMDCHELKTMGNPTVKHQEAINKIKEKYGL